MTAEHDLEAACERLEEVMRSNAAGFGPSSSAEPLLSEWVLLAAWTDAETGEISLTRTNPNGMAEHHVSGMLHRALYQMDD